MLMTLVVVRLICGAISAFIASSKGRSAVGWFIGGFFLTIIAIIIVALLSDLKKEQAQRERDMQERRRLRERLRQEQLKNEAFRRHATARLDAHDQHLGIETRGAGQLATGPQATLQLDTAEDSADEPVIRWYFEIGGETMGPKTQPELEDLFRQGKLGLSTLVCREGEENWRPANTVPCFRFCGTKPL